MIMSFSVGTTQGQTPEENTSESALTTKSPIDEKSGAVTVPPGGEGSSTMSVPSAGEKIRSPWQFASSSQELCGK